METLRRLKAARPEIAVIVVTALADRDVAKRALTAGATDCLTKPLSLDLLDTALVARPDATVTAAAPASCESAAVAGAAAPTRRTFFARS
jgi:CheY-like chemotaxis protein